MRFLFWSGWYHLPHHANCIIIIEMIQPPSCLCSNIASIYFTFIMVWRSAVIGRRLLGLSELSLPSDDHPDVWPAAQRQTKHQIFPDLSSRESLAGNSNMAISTLNKTASYSPWWIKPDYTSLCPRIESITLALRWYLLQSKFPQYLSRTPTPSH